MPLQADNSNSGSSVITHPFYAYYLPDWQRYVHIYDGSGGFKDGTFLVAHPREWKDWEATTPRTPTKKFQARRTLARYENVAATILDQKRSAIFRESIVRTLDGKASEEPHPLEDWWQDVDGYGCSINDWMSESFVFAALFGHIYHYMDLPEGETAYTAADQSTPYLRKYTPIDVPDWRYDDRGRLIAVRLLEAEPQIDINEPYLVGRIRERVVTEDEWLLRTMSGKGNGKVQVMATTGPQPHSFGTLPVVVHYAKRRRLAQGVGQSVLGDPKLYIDLFNIMSEIRELLRDQTFGMLNVPLGVGDNATDILKAQTMMQDEKGASNVLFTPAPAQYVQPDPGNVTVYLETYDRTLRTIYRLVGLPWEADSKDAEAEGSLEQKRENLNQLLAGYADECEKVEYDICKLWFRSQYGESWEREWDNAQVRIHYPDRFDVKPLADLVAEAQAAVSLEMGQTFMAELRKSLVAKFLPDLSPDTQAEIDKELDEIEVKSEATQRQEEMKAKFGGKKDEAA